tara:strand:- start:350 stop:499 length:150 start_codon:yes stop_codon:yes gene_type:complete
MTEAEKERTAERKRTLIRAMALASTALASPDYSDLYKPAICRPEKYRKR